MQCSKVFRIPMSLDCDTRANYLKQGYGVTKGTGILNTVDPIGHGHNVRILLLVSCNLIGQ